MPMTRMSRDPAAVADYFPRHPVVAGTDRDHARDVLSEVFLPLELEPVGSGAQLDVRLNVVKVGRVTAGYLRFGEAVGIRTVETVNYHVDIPTTGRALMRTGLHDPVYGTPGLGAIFMPDLPAKLDWGRGCAQVCLMLPRAELQLELERLLGYPIGQRLDFTPALDLTSIAGGTLLRTLRLIDHDSRRSGGLLDHPLAEQHLEHLLLDSLLLAAPHKFSGALGRAAPLAGRRPVARAVELLRSSPERAWTISELAVEVSVSVRSLQEGFRTGVGVPPMRYLRSLRLDRAHDELVAAEPGSVTVAGVAARWGFTHLGRFAGDYGSRYRETPSETLRAGRPQRLRNAEHAPGPRGDMHVEPGVDISKIQATEVADAS
ncbi:MAG: hypothetical protein QOF39_2930 [Frankiales bacterium]|nr:hypothetical protein [Frankiales bacterium]